MLFGRKHFSFNAIYLTMMNICLCFIIPIYSSMFNFSWGPDDNGKTVDGPHRLAQVNSCQITFVFKLAI